MPRTQPYTLPAAVRRTTADMIELFIMNRSDESLAVAPARFRLDESGRMAAYRMRWLRSGHHFAVTTHPDGHFTDSRRPGRAMNLRYLDNQGRPYTPPGWKRAMDLRDAPSGRDPRVPGCGTAHPVLARECVLDAGHSPDSGHFDGGVSWPSR